MQQDAKGRSFFDMGDVHKVCGCRNIDEAKAIALEAIDRFPGATKENIFKARVAVSKATTPTKLGIMMTNFFFAHPSEGLKTVKGSQVFQRRPVGQDVGGISGTPDGEGGEDGLRPSQG